MGLWMALGAILLLGIIMQTKQACFSETLPGNFKAKNAILAFEMLDDERAMHDLVDANVDNCPPDASQARLNSLRRNTLIDFGFIVAYSAFLYFLIRLLLPYPAATIGLALVAGAAVLDVLENGAGLYLIRAYEAQTEFAGYLSWMKGFAVAKWMLLFSLLCYLGFKVLRKYGILWWVFAALYGAGIIGFLWAPLEPIPLVGSAMMAMINLSLLLLIALMVTALRTSSLNKVTGE